MAVFSFASSDYTTNQNVVLTINLVSGNYNDYEYSFDGGTTWSSSYTKEFSSNQDVYIKIRDNNGYVSDNKIVNITKIDKELPTISYDNSIEYNIDHTTKQVSTLIVTLSENTSILSGVNTADNLSGVASGYPKCYYNNSEISSSSVFSSVGRYQISCTVQDNAGNFKSENREVLVRWPTGGKYVVKKIQVDGLGIAGEGLSLSTTSDGLYKDTAASGANVGLPFASKYYYSGASVDNYLSFAGTTFRIINVSTNDNIKLLGDISDVGTSWGSLGSGSEKIFDSRTYDTWSTKWWVRGQIYNRETNESHYYEFTDDEKDHISLATFYAGRLSTNDAVDISYTVYYEQTNTIDLGGTGNPAFEGYSAYPNVSDYLKASKTHDVISCINDIDINSSVSNRSLFRSNSWIDMSTEVWTLNGRTGSALGAQDDNFWTVDTELGGVHFESRRYSTSRNYRVVFYLTASTILSGDGSSSSPYNVEEDWAWFDSYQQI